MGPRTIRITRDEFLTPPEFRGFEPVGHPAARVGGARIELVRAGCSTRLGRSYQQVPIRFLPPFDLDGEPACLLYLINLTAGLLDGDGHLIELVARAGTRAIVTGQSSTRVHPALESHSTQQWAVLVEDDACLVVLPGPTIPYRGSRYFQRARVELAPRARLIWGDVWLAGRYERGALSERFEFERIVQDFEVRRSGQLVYRDRFRWDGPWSPEQAQWHFGGFLASASLFVSGRFDTSAALHAPPSAVRRAVFPTASGGHCIRWCGHPPDVIADLVLCAMGLAAQAESGPDIPPWLLTSTELTPNHWFSP